MQLTLNLMEPPPPRLADLVIGRNAAALHAVQLLAADTPKAHQSVLLWGVPGSGKSFWMRAWAAELGPRAALIDAGQAAGDTAVVAFERLLEAMDQPAQDRLVMIDDADKASSRAQDLLFQLYNAARESQWRMLLSTSAPPTRLSLRDDLRTRMGQGLVFELHELNDDEKKEALRDRAARLGLPLPEEVLSYLTTRLPRDMGLLTRVLDGLAQYSLSLHRAPTIPLLKELLDSLDATPRAL
jgi:DnaA family protein